MDNIEQAPQGEADVTASSGQSDEVDTQPVETEAKVEPVDGGEAEAPAETGQSAPWEADPKFKGKTPEDVYKAYKEVEKLSGQLSQKARLANLIEQQYGVTPDKLEKIVTQQAEQERNQLYQTNPIAPVMDKVTQLENKLALQETEKELDNFLKESPEYEKFRDKILNLGLSVHQNESFENIAKDYFGEAIAQGQQSAYKKIDTKRMTQATSASQATPKSGLTEADMDKMTAAELEQVLPWADISHRL